MLNFVGSRERTRVIPAKEITEVHLSDLSDGGVPVRSGERLTILFMARNEEPDSYGQRNDSIEGDIGSV